ncbi:MAG: hypothetical protein WC491_03615 [Candidatus Omnitrophota bacterium]
MIDISQAFVIFLILLAAFSIFKLFSITGHKYPFEVYFPKHRFVIAFCVFWSVYIIFDRIYKLSDVSTSILIFLLLIIPMLAWSKKLYLKGEYFVIENYLFRPKQIFLKDIESVDYDWEEMQYYINKYVDNFIDNSNETIPEPYAKHLRLPLNVVFWIFGIDYDKHIAEAGDSIELFEKRRDLIRNSKEWTKLIPREEVISIIKTMQVNIMPMLIIKPRDGKKMRIMYSFESEYFIFIEQVRKEIEESKSKVDTRMNV